MALASKRAVLSTVLIILMMLQSAPAYASSCIFPASAFGGGPYGNVKEITELDENSDRLIGGPHSLFEFKDGTLHQVPNPGMSPRYIREITSPVADARLIRARNGLFRLVKGSLSLVPGTEDTEIGLIDEITPPVDGVRLVDAENGLFRLENGRLSEVPGARGAVTRSSVNEISQPDENGDRLIGAWSRLFRLVDDTLSPVPDTENTPIGKIEVITPSVDGVRLIGTSDGLFRFKDDRLSPVSVAEGIETGYIIEIMPSVNNVRLVTAENGLYHLKNNSLSLVPGAERIVTGTIWEITEPKNGARLIRARNGLFKLKDGRVSLIPPAENTSPGTINVITPSTTGDHLLGTSKGLFRLVDGEVNRGPSVRNRPPWSDPLYITEITQPHNGVRLIRTYSGIYQLEDDAISRVPIAGNTRLGEILTITSPDERGVRLIGTVNGLFRLSPFIKPVISDNRSALLAENGKEYTFRWDLDLACAPNRSWGDLLQVVLSESGETLETEIHLRESTSETNRLHVSARTMISPHDGPELKAFLKYRDDSLPDPWVRVPGSETTINIGSRVEDDTTDDARRYGFWIVVAHTLFFFASFIKAPSLPWAWRVMTDPLWGKFGLWFNFLLRHSPPSQRWLLRGWFNKTRSHISRSPYLQTPLTDADGGAISSSDLISKLSPAKRLWIQGVSGMGKTRLLEEMIADYFCSSDLPTPAKTNSAFGFIPIPIALRNFAAVAVPAVPENWIFDITARTLESAGFNIEDLGLLRSILTSGYFVLILDGANEVDDQGAILQFARRYPNVGLVVTSQTVPDAEDGIFDVWKLPPDIQAAIDPLLKLYLDEERGTAAFNALKSSAIKEDIHSGYDVRLLADLIDGGVTPTALPHSRLALYESMLSSVSSVDGTPYRAEALCEISWKMWAEGRRDLTPGQNISEPLFNPLIEKRVKIVQTLDGEHYEFRHDQMRGYLAARWAAVHEVSPINLFKKAQPDIWRIQRGDQQVVWEFFAEMIEPAEGAKILHWSTLEAERAALQVALRRVALRDNWPQSG